MQSQEAVNTQENVVDREIAVEQRRLDLVYARLAVAEEEARQLAAEGHRRATLGHEGGLLERDALVHAASRRIAEIGRQHEGLVFGRLDLSNGEVRYIGRLGVRDAEHEPLVIDWRAPAAEPFYRATAERPLGVVRRRVIRSSGARVLGVEDDLLDADALPDGMPIVGDGALVAALAQARTGRMRDIVATIQHEQDAAVRSSARGVTLITGGPGTGKTVVALHRAAYLLFSDRRRYEAGGVLIVGPSDVFMRYIEQVLPSLGEHSATLRAIGDVVDSVRATGRDTLEAARIKGSPSIRRVLSKALRDGVPGAPTDFRMIWRGELLRLTPQDLIAARRGALARGARWNRSRGRADDLLVSAFRKQAGPGLPDDFTEQIRDRNEYQDFLHAWWPPVTPLQVFGWLTDPALLPGYARGVLTPAEVAELLDGWRAAKGELSAYDAALVDEIALLTGRPPRPRRGVDELELAGVAELSTLAERELTDHGRTERPEDYDEYAHLIVDEAQDLSPMQWRMLGRRAKQAGWTVVGDAAQSVWPDDATAAEARDAALGRQPRTTFRLSTNYRNPAEIYTLAADLVRAAVPGADLPQAVRETGHPPVHLVAAPEELAEAVRDAVDGLLAQVAGTVGVITARSRRDALVGLAGPRVQVVDDFEAKGLEYDGVLVVEPAELLAEPRGVRALYVALTRATQRLTTIGADLSWLPAGS